VVLDAVGVAQAELVADEGSPVVREQVNAVELECVQQRNDVGQKLLPRVSPPRSVGPARTAQVRPDHAVVLGQPRDDLAPLPPVLGEAVEQQDRFTVAGLGQVHAQPGEINEAVLDSVERGERSRRRAGLPPAARLGDSVVGAWFCHAATVLRS
jgi:hypothetical protein